MKITIIKIILTFVVYVGLAYIGQWLFRSSMPFLGAGFGLLVIIASILIIPKKFFK
jgi:hypothetical protein